MTIKKIFGIILFFGLVMFTSKAIEAASVGTLQKTMEVNVEPGGTAEFIILFWSNDDSTKVFVETENVPDGWSVIQKPRELFLEKPEAEAGNYGEGNYIRMPGVDGYVKVEDLKIYVKVPESAEPGGYIIIANAIVGNPSQGISVYQQRDFELKVNVRKMKIIDRFTRAAETTPEKIAEVTMKFKNGITNLAIQPKVPESIVVAMVFIAVVVGSVMIFRRVVK
jgi:hypothetical protein